MACLLLQVSQQQQSNYAEKCAELGISAENKKQILSFFVVPINVNKRKKHNLNPKICLKYQIVFYQLLPLANYGVYTHTPNSFFKT